MTLQSNISTTLDVVFRRSDLKMDVYGRTTNNTAVPTQQVLSVPGVYVLPAATVSNPAPGLMVYRRRMIVGMEGSYESAGH